MVIIAITSRRHAPAELLRAREKHKARRYIQWCEKVLAPFLIFFFLHVCHTLMFQIIKQI